MPILEISVVPVGTGQASFSSYVAEACQAIQERGLPFQVTPTCTVVEGELDQLLQVAADMHAKALAHGAPRVITSLTIDDRRDRPLDLGQSVETVITEMEHREA